MSRIPHALDVPGTPSYGSRNRSPHFKRISDEGNGNSSAQVENKNHKTQDTL